MTDKRFKLEDCVVNGVGEIVGVYFQDNHNNELLKYEDIVRIANGLHEENEQLKQFIQELTTKGTGKIHLANGYTYKVNAILTDFKW